MSDRLVCVGCGCQRDEDGCGCEEEVLSDKAHCFRCGGQVDERPRLDCVYLCGDCAGKDWHVETDKGPVVWRSYSKPKTTRLVEAVEQGLSDEDRDTLSGIRDLLKWEEDPNLDFPMDHTEEIDFLDRLPGMIEDRDRELADAEYEVLCAKLEADTARQILTDALERGRDHAVAALYCKLAHAEIEIRRLRGLLDGESHG